MPSPSRRALADHRRRQKRMGLARVEIQVLSIDAALIRNVARRLRGGDPDAEALRAQLRAAAAPAPSGGSILDRLACDLPEETFAPMLRRDRRPARDVEL